MILYADMRVKMFFLYTKYPNINVAILYISANERRTRQTSGFGCMCNLLLDRLQGPALVPAAALRRARWGFFCVAASPNAHSVGEGRKAAAAR